MQPLPTDLAILNAIYDRHYRDFCNFDEKKPSRRTKIYVPIDVVSIARDLNVDSDIVFGRLHFHLEHKYFYRNEDASKVHLFTLDVEPDEAKRNTVHFPYMASVLAELREQQARHDQIVWFSAAAVLVAIVATVISIFK